MAGTAQAPRTYPAEVIRFAEEQGVRALLDPVVLMTESIYPEASAKLEIDDDPEIASDQHILIRVKSRFVNVEQELEKISRWHDGLFRCCPSIHVWVFRLAHELIK